MHIKTVFTDIDKYKKCAPKKFRVREHVQEQLLLHRCPKRSLAWSNVEISGDFHRNVAVYHAVKNIARIIRRYSNWIYIHRDSRWSGLSAAQGHSCTDKWVFQ